MNVLQNGAGGEGSEKYSREIQMRNTAMNVSANQDQRDRELEQCMSGQMSEAMKDPRCLKSTTTCICLFSVQICNVNFEHLWEKSIASLF